MLKNNEVIGTALIKFTENELDLIILCLLNTRRMRIPTKNYEWRKPIKKLSEDLINIRQQLEEKKNSAT
jgi:hypothetical protein|tara:strand:+ start:2880 stop:3086 length:207 start_codon:yes stop_codon:yes gene_type:complete